MKGRSWTTMLAIVAGLGALPAAAADRTIAISIVVEVPQLVETKEGVLKGMADKGVTADKGFKIEYQTANGNMPTQQQIAKKFVGEGVDVIVAITTPTAQAMAAATKDIPIVFATVTDPVKAKLIDQYKHPGGNITGVSDAAPIAEQLKLFRELVPNLKRIGFVYNPGLDSSKATLSWMQEQTKPFGITVVEAAAPTTNEVIPSTRKLVGNVDAIYVPNDTTVVAALETVIKVGQETKTPVFTGETRGVERGAVASLGLNYIEVGRLAGHMVAEILAGKKAGDIDAVIAYEAMPNFNVVVNKSAAASMGVSIPAAVLSRATKVVD
jgi:putative tryptophan/tyrosine transport system substrate-binding protein